MIEPCSSPLASLLLVHWYIVVWCDVSCPVQSMPGPPPTSGFSSSSSSSQPYRAAATTSVWSSEQASGTSPLLTYHWFYLRSLENYWIPFSLTDSAALENAVTSSQNSSEQVKCWQSSTICIQIMCSILPLCFVLAGEMVT